MLSLGGVPRVAMFLNVPWWLKIVVELRGGGQGGVEEIKAFVVELVPGLQSWNLDTAGCKIQKSRAVIQNHRNSLSRILNKFTGCLLYTSDAADE